MLLPTHGPDPRSRRRVAHAMASHCLSVGSGCRQPPVRDPHALHPDFQSLPHLVHAEDGEFRGKEKRPEFGSQSLILIWSDDVRDRRSCLLC